MKVVQYSVICWRRDSGRRDKAPDGKRPLRALAFVRLRGPQLTVLGLLTGRGGALRYA